MIVLGVILLLIGWLVPGLSILTTIGIVLLLVGVVLFALGSSGHSIGPRRHYF